MVSEGRRASLKRWGEIGWCRTRQQKLCGPQDAAPPSGVGWGSTEELASRVVAKRLVLKRIGLPLTLSLKRVMVTCAVSASGSGARRGKRDSQDGRRPSPQGEGCHAQGGAGENLSRVYIYNQIDVYSFFM